jgi:geranylgeranyl diphosphate synthase, type II
MPERSIATALRGVRAHPARGGGDFVRTLGRYRDVTLRALLDAVPNDGPPYLYELVLEYPRRLGKGLRAALCLATCSALGGGARRALNAAIAAELFHNAFLIHDDIQDESLQRRGAPTLHRDHGVGIAVNVGNATNLLGLDRVLENRAILGPRASWLIAEETARMMRHSLEGQAIELGWIRDNACVLSPRDYLRMCLKKTSWYSFIYPMRVGAIVAEGRVDSARFCRLGWYFGAAFQIQDDILNLNGDYAQYGKEIGGDLWEGKRTLMLIRLLRRATVAQRRALVRFLAKPRAERTAGEIQWIHQLMVEHGAMEYARRISRHLAGAALIEALRAFRGVPDSEHKRFILEMVLYVVDRNR